MGGPGLFEIAILGGIVMVPILILIAAVVVITMSKMRKRDERVDD